MHDFNQLLADLQPYLQTLDSVLVILNRITALTCRRPASMTAMTTPAPRAPLSLDQIDCSRAELAGILWQLLDQIPTESHGKDAGSTMLLLIDPDHGDRGKVTIQPDQLAPLTAMLAELLPDAR
ncbi:hypothetical protein [Kitasatospora cathayae]|uniref:Uncharacterized protein n=1 Tax=Kitasatospora cathayae TaxID=3004092 RepID=A0ABY7QH71_9ACTN|nr:hypothetical protein [Kitasatospora sp. HUAS 3-15]WBP92175.1 hypothetical protein O1G21_41250 [Kitasatospora sp. HUAS 3-15]